MGVELGKELALEITPALVFCGCGGEPIGVFCEPEATLRLISNSTFPTFATGDVPKSRPLVLQVSRAGQFAMRAEETYIRRSLTIICAEQTDTARGV